jgi:myo-inositol-1(or 4)-monophosphatase
MDLLNIYALLQRHPGGIPVGTDLGSADFPVLAADREETLARFMPWGEALVC